MGNHQIQSPVGHEADWDALVKMHDSIFGNMPNAHWDMFDKAVRSGQRQHLDRDHAVEISGGNRCEPGGGKAGAVWGERRSDKADDSLAASTIESIETNLFAVNPKMSYPADNWKAADPGFWGQQ